MRGRGTKQLSLLRLEKQREEWDYYDLEAWIREPPELACRPLWSESWPAGAGISEGVR